MIVERFLVSAIGVVSVQLIGISLFNHSKIKKNKNK